MPADIHDSDRDRDRERDPDRKPKGSSSSKTKDLSHVPCKFFKVGGCTAGSSCPFSHTTQESGAQKETCTWFVKGNCKFGHKCALAHVLPGQSMTMDRKNKKAAQVAAAGSEKGKTSSTSRVKRGSPGLLAGGSTAPMRIVQGSASRVPLKATISPSAPAPPLKDTDFASLINDDVLPHSQPASESDEKEPKEAAAPAPPPQKPDSPVSVSANVDFGPIGSPPGFRAQPISPGTSPRNNGVNITNGTSASLLSSSPAASSYQYTQHNTGIAASLGSGLAMMGGRKGWGDAPDTMGQPNSFSGLLSAQLDDFAPSSLRNSRRPFRQDSALDEGDMEDFVPGSLTDLLTPEERSRRMSRSTSGQGPQVQGDNLAVKGTVSGLTSALKGSGGLSQQAAEANDGSSNNGALGSNGMGHRYSRSVPAPSLLGDLRSIWADNSTIPAVPSSPHRGTPGSVSGFHNSRFGASDHFSGNGAFANDDFGAAPTGLSTSIGMNSSMSLGTSSSFGAANMSLSPSNASAAFLPGMHHHYLSAKQKQAQAQQAALGLGGAGAGRGGLAMGRNVTAPIGAVPGAGNGTGAGLSSGLAAGAAAGQGNPNSLANNYMSLGLPSSATSSSGFHTHTHGGTQTTYRAAPNPFDLTQTLTQNQNQQRVSALGMTREKSGGSAYGNFSGMGGAMAGGFGGAGGAGAAGVGGGVGGGLGGGLADDPGYGWGGNTILSPSTRALQAHAPGQSLPQGLAAGYSRIHALPPLADIAASPPPQAGERKELNPIDEDLDWPSVNMAKTQPPGLGMGMGMSPGQAHGGYLHQQHQQQLQQQQQQPQQGTGLEGMFSRLSYSAAASARGGVPASPGPPGLTRTVSGGRPQYVNAPQQQGGAGPLSPLSGPVVTRDDDDLFDMDK